MKRREFIKAIPAGAAAVALLTAEKNASAAAPSDADPCADIMRLVMETDAPVLSRLTWPDRPTDVPSDVDWPCRLHQWSEEDLVTHKRVRRANICQIIAAPISGTVGVPPEPSEFDAQLVMRTTECVRDLEKAVLRSRAAAHDITGREIPFDRLNEVPNHYRTMRGLLSWVEEGVELELPADDPLKYIDGAVADLLSDIAGRGATDIDTLVVGFEMMKALRPFLHEGYRRTASGAAQQVWYLDTPHGQAEAVVSRWMPPTFLLAIARQRVLVRVREPFHVVGDRVYGDYTTEVHFPNKIGLIHARGRL